MRTFVLSLAFAIGLPLAPPALVAQDIKINITGPGATAKYIKEGDAAQLAVEVTVGQTVRFSNTVMTTATHTATSNMKDAMGNRIFNTGNIAVGTFKDVAFDAALYKKAGGTPGGQVDLDYFCALHPATMKSKIILKDAPRASGPLRVRKNVMSLTANEVKTLRKGVEVMRARPADNRKSWAYWANIHGMPAPSPDPLHRQCKHGTDDFLVWHRAYLYYFEQILREASGDPALTLPYWDWTTHPKLPPIYRDPIGIVNNSLFDANRVLNNPALSIPANVVTADLNDALAQIRYFPGFAQDLDDSPHGAIHVITGGSGGTMSRVPTSARDPIFWAHHSNVDRIWNVWLRLDGGRENPSDPVFLNRKYTFVDTRGEDVTITAGEAISSVALGYRYDDEPDMTEGPSLRLLASSRADTALETLADPIALGPDSVRVVVKSVGGSAGSVTVVRIKNVSFKAMPGFVYGVYLQLPDDAEADTLPRHKIGTLSFFSQEEHIDGHEARPFTKTFDATRTIQRLRAAGVNLEGDLSVTFRPITLEAELGHEEELRELNATAAQAAGVTIDAVEFLTE